MSFISDCISLFNIKLYIRRYYILKLSYFVIIDLLLLLFLLIINIIYYLYYKYN